MSGGGKTGGAEGGKCLRDRVRDSVKRAGEEKKFNEKKKGIQIIQRNLYTFYNMSDLKLSGSLWCPGKDSNLHALAGVST